MRLFYFCSEFNDCSKETPAYYLDCFVSAFKECCEPIVTTSSTNNHVIIIFFTSASPDTLALPNTLASPNTQASPDWLKFSSHSIQPPISPATTQPKFIIALIYLKLIPNTTLIFPVNSYFFCSFICVYRLFNNSFQHS